MKRNHFQELTSIRLKEAKVLLKSGCWEGAYYLGGYAAECALKACIAKQTERYDFPDKDRVNASYSHDLGKLAILAGLDEEIGSFATNHPELNRNWSIVREWWEQSRYERPSQLEAERLVGALEQRKHGVLQWLKRHW